jgi:hypothetical protein
MDLKLFIDLDECLVSTIPSNNPKKGRTKIVLDDPDLPKPEVYYSIEYCRSKGQTFMLTAAATDYALEHNRVFNLGFTDDAVIGRELYCYYKSGMLHDSIIPIRANIYPNSILVDNQDPNRYGSENLRAKMAFLGIKEDRLVKSREYMGGKQPPDFSKEIDQIEKILCSTL